MIDELSARSVKKNASSLNKLCKDLKVIYTDVDGTIVGPEGSLFNSPQGQPTLHPSRAIIKILEKGLDLVPVSGRSRIQLGADTRLLGFKNFICELGCQVVHNLGEEIFNLHGDLEVEGTMYEAIAKTSIPDLLLSQYKGYLEYHTPWSKGRECTHVFRGFINLEQARNMVEEAGHKELTLIDNGIVHRRGNLNRSIPEIHAYHLLPKTAGKEAGIRKDLEIRGMEKKEAIAIGDAMSDLDMANDVAVLFLMKNAITKHSQEINDEIAKYENVYVTDNEMGLGFAEIIYTLLGF